MHAREPSRTAFAAAAHRAAHQVLEGGRIFCDPLALAILGMTPQAAQAAAAKVQAQPGARGLRLFIAARSELAERRLAQGVEARGVRQAVVLGAGLDTFAYRHALGDRLRVFEADHPATQAWKRARLVQAGIAAPASMSFAPVDFEREALGDALTRAGFDPQARSFFMWLGVVPYLTPATVESTLGWIASLPGGGEVVFDYGEPPASLSPELRAAHEARAARVASPGEPFLSCFEPQALHARLAALGFSHIEDLGPRALFALHLDPSAVTTAPPPERGGHVVFAAT